MDAMNALLTRVPRFHIYPRFHARTALTSMPTESKEQVREESKHADVPAVDEKADRQVSELVADFAEFCTTDVFGEELQEFERDNCRQFRDANIEDEQPLEWTETWKAYVTIVEKHMDEFCDAHNTTAEIIFEEIDSIKHDPFVSEFLPQVLLNIEYDHFIKQMKEAADEAFNREEAESCAQVEFLPGSKVNISGTYRAHSSYKYDEDNFNSYLQAVGAPWVLRKLIIKTTRNIDDVFVVQDESSMAFKFKMKFFGSRSTTHHFDEPVFKKNIWGIETFQVASLDREGVKVRIQNHPRLLPDGHTEHTFFLDDDDVLNWKWHLVHPSANKEMVHVLKFERQTSYDHK